MAGSVLWEVVVAAAAQVLKVLAEYPWLALLIPVFLFLTFVAWAAAGIVCAAAACRWIRTRDDLPEDVLRRLITAVIWRFLRLRDPPSQTASPQDAAGNDDTSVI